MTAAIDTSVLDQIVKRARRLYSLPTVALRILELANQPTFDAAALKACLEHDPALTSKILRVVNSSLFGLSSRVTDLNQALALLGTKPLRLLVLGFSLPEGLTTGLAAEVLERYWRRTIIKATAAREFAESLWKVPGDEAFIAALLQDLGALVLIQELGDAYITFLDRVAAETGDLLTLETATLGFDHYLLTARLLEHWGLPTSLVLAIGQRPDVAELREAPVGKGTVPQIMHVADLLADLLTQPHPGRLQALLEAASAYREATLAEIEPLVVTLQAKVNQLAEILSLELPDSSDYAQILLQAYAALREAAEEATPDLLTRQAESVFLQTHERSMSIAEAAEGLQSALVAPVTTRTRTPSAVKAAAGNSALAPRHVNDPGLLGYVETACATCRQVRSALSFALLEVDHPDRLVLRLGVEQSHELLRSLHHQLAISLQDEGRLLQVDDYRFAVILEGMDRPAAVELLRQLLRTVRQWSCQQPTLQRWTLTLSAGVATLAMPPKNFPCTELISAAERCLHGVQLSSGDGVKSIHIC